METLIAVPSIIMLIIVYLKQNDQMKKEDYINFDKNKIDRLETAYKKAKEQGKFQFEFDEKEYITDYAKYLLEYLKPTMKL